MTQFALLYHNFRKLQLFSEPEQQNGAAWMQRQKDNLWNFHNPDVAQLIVRLIEDNICDECHIGLL